MPPRPERTGRHGPVGRAPPHLFVGSSSPRRAENGGRGEPSADPSRAEPLRHELAGGWLTGLVETSDPTPTPHPSQGRSPTDERSLPLSAAFAPPAGMSWKRVAPALAWYRRIVIGVLCLLVGGGGALLLFFWTSWPWAVAWAALVLVVLVTGWILAGLFRRSWGYAEASEELYLTYGVFVRQLVVVPYGRMQVVDVTADLLEQALGIATVRVRTAASTADTRVVALPLIEAVRMRDRLAARSESFSTGL